MRTTVALLFLLAPACVFASTPPHASQWTVVERPGSILFIERTSANSLRVQATASEQGLALQEDSTYVGVIEERLPVADVRVVRVRQFRAQALPDGQLRVTLRNGWESGSEVVQTWRPVRGEVELFGPLSSSPDLPPYGEVVRVDHPAEPRQRFEPEYPQIAREAGVDGTVLVQALVDAEGRVRDVRVTKSIPMLDASAIQCVKRWTFTPATRGWLNVPTWVEARVPFVLK